MKINSCRMLIYLNLLFSSIVIVAVLYQLDRLPLDDDRLYFYTLTTEYTESDLNASMTEEILEGFGNFDYDDKMVDRFQFRYDYRNNYQFHILTTLVAKMFAPIPEHRFYMEWVKSILQNGAFLGHFICLMIVLYAFWSGRNRELVFSAVVFAGLALVLHFLFNVDDTSTAYEKIIRVIVTPGVMYEYFGDTPRSAATLLLFAVVAFRWGERNAAAYWVIAFMSFVHGTYGLMALLAFGAVDTVISPEKLKKVNVLIPASIPVLKFAVTGSAWGSLGGAFLLLATFVLMAGVFAFTISPPGARMLKKFPGVTKMQRADRIVSDVILISAGAMAAAVVGFVIAKFGQDLAGQYIGRNLMYRFPGFFRVPIGVGLIFLFFQKIVKTDVLSVRSSLAVGIAALTVVSFTFFRMTNLQEVRFTNSPDDWISTIDMEQTIKGKIEKQGAGSYHFTEREIYYAMACQIDGQCHFLTDMMSSDLKNWSSK